MNPLSKSKILAFRQCPKRLWMEVHRPELREDSADAQARFQTGYQVGNIARRLYDPEGTGAVIDVDTEGFDAAFARTAELLASFLGPVFEAGFRAGGALAFADVMLPTFEHGQSAWRMVEVKSSTSVKDYHRDDMAVQAFVAQSAGVNLKSVALAHIDSSWVYPGNEDYRGLLVESDLTAEALTRSGEVKGWIEQAQRIVAQPAAPDIAVGAHCSAPFECGFCSYCIQGHPQSEFPIAWLPRLSATKRKQLAEQGVDDLCGVPDDLLSDKQAMIKEHTLAKTVFFDAAGAAADLAPHGFPAYFLDFESIQFPVPIWKGTRPYQQIAFQFSLHTLGESGLLSQTAFLDLSGDDPSEPFANALIAACGETGPVFVYNAGFEKTRIRELAERYPALAGPLRGFTQGSWICIRLRATATITPANRAPGASRRCCPPLRPSLATTNSTAWRMAEWPWTPSLRPSAPAPARHVKPKSKGNFSRIAGWIRLPWCGCGSSSAGALVRHSKNELHCARI